MPCPMDCSGVPPPTQSAFLRALHAELGTHEGTTPRSKTPPLSLPSRGLVVPGYGGTRRD